jgi:hypothetical protein
VGSNLMGRESGAYGREGRQVWRFGVCVLTTDLVTVVLGRRDADQVVVTRTWDKLGMRRLVALRSPSRWEWTRAVA